MRSSAETRREEDELWWRNSSQPTSQRVTSLTGCTITLIFPEGTMSNDAYPLAASSRF